jgi:hypothetical protein
VISHDSQAKNDVFDMFRADMEAGFTNFRTDMNAGFDMFRADMNAGFDMFRADMDAGFEALHATVVRRLTQIGVITLLEMIAILSIDRWWR